MENKVLAAFIQSRDAWAAAATHVSEKDFSPHGALILKLIKEYYELDKDATTVDRDILCSRIDRAVNSPKIAAMVVGAVKGLPVEVSGVNVAKEVLALKADRIGKTLASALLAGKSNEDVRRLISEYQDISTRDSLKAEEEEVISSIKVGELLEKSFSKDNLIPLWPKSLSERIDGGARPGHHILVFAPTEMGKTLFVINMVAGFIKNNLKVLYIGNEDPAADISMRLINRLTGMNKYEVEADPRRAQELLDRRGGDNFLLAPLAPGNFPRIHRLVEQYAPDVVVIDQLRNLDVDSENRTQALEKAATEARNTAKRYNVLVVSVTQAADSASGKVNLTRGDVDSSNVGIPGQVDLMIGIGATEEMEANNIRVLSFPKNKLSGNHAPLEVLIDPTLSKVIEVGE